MSNVDDALDRLDERAAGSGIEDADVEVLRAELERLREERDDLREVGRVMGHRAEAAEAEVTRLTAERDEARDDKLKLHDWGFQWKRRARAAEAELQRTREGLRARDELLGRILDYGASGYEEALARRPAWITTHGAASSRPPGDTEGGEA